MPSALADRRLLGALAAARHRLEAVHPADPIAAGLADASRQLVTRAEAALDTAVELEDREEVEAIRAADRRREAFDALGDAFGRLYAGLTAGVAIAKLRGETGASLADLHVYLEDTSPSGFRLLSLQASLSTFATARRWADAYIPAELLGDLLPEIDPVFAEAQRAHAVAEKEAGEATTAFRSLEAAREAARRDYVAARSVLQAAFRIEGSTEGVGKYLPPLARVLRGSRGRRGDPEVGSAEGSAVDPGSDRGLDGLGGV